MKCWVNDILVSEGNVKDMDWTFAEIIERVSYQVTIYPGEVIGSGTVGTGCKIKSNQITKSLSNPNRITSGSSLIPLKQNQRIGLYFL
jgi:fumarylacetoacetate (FAA) hydrolase